MTLLLTSSDTHVSCFNFWASIPHLYINQLGLNKDNAWNTFHIVPGPEEGFNMLISAATALPVGESVGQWGKISFSSFVFCIMF